MSHLRVCQFHSWVGFLVFQALIFIIFAILPCNIIDFSSFFSDRVMAVTTMSNPKPFICQDCKKTFVSLDKLNHHQHKFHGVPSKLTLSINRPSVPTSSSENIPDITPTPSTLLQDGEFTGVLEDVHKDTDTPTMRKLLQEYQITPSVFDKDFRDSFAKAAGKSSPGSASQNPRSRNPSRTPTVSRQNSQTQTIEGSSAKREEPFPMVPFSPFSFLINHLNSFGQMNSGVAVPTSIPSTVMTIPATTMAYPSFITNNSLLQGGLLLGQAMQSSSDRDKLHTQLSQLWAAASSSKSFVCSFQWKVKLINCVWL